MSLKLIDGGNVHLLSARLPSLVDRVWTGEDAVDRDGECRWAFNHIRALLPFFNSEFALALSGVDVLCAIIINPSVNAYASPDRVVLVTDRAIRTIHSACQRLPESPTLARSEQGFDDAVGVAALATLLGHELGHLHGRHFGARSPTLEPNLPLANEISADGWAMMACADAIDGMFCAGQPPNAVGKLAFECMRVLIGFGLVDTLDWSFPWVMAGSSSHPPGEVRLTSAALKLGEHLSALASKWPDHPLRDLPIDAIVTMASLPMAAQALTWLSTGAVAGPMKFVQAMAAHGDGWRANMDVLREADRVARERRMRRAKR